MFIVLSIMLLMIAKITKVSFPYFYSLMFLISNVSDVKRMTCTRLSRSVNRKNVLLRDLDIANIPKKEILFLGCVSSNKIF